MSDKAASAADILRKRSLLFSFRMRFSPQTQPVRQAAIDKILEQSLVLADYEVGWSVNDIQEQVGVWFRGGRPAITRLDIEDSLGRLTRVDRALAIPGGQETRYKLSDQALQEVGQLREEAETRFQGVVGRLFENAPGGDAAYAAPFLECLCVIFSELTEAYVRVLKEEITRDDLLRLPSVPRALREVNAKHEGIETEALEQGVLRFFRESCPEHDAIKWNMAQNYYVVKALGVDPSGYLLSRELFGNAVFYLDTNVIIDALEPRAQFHRSFQALSGACKALGIELAVCQISLEELERVVDHYRDLIGKVARQIPTETLPKVRGAFFEVYREAEASRGAADLDQLFAAFARPGERLRASYGVEVVDDPWFAQGEDEPETSELLAQVREERHARKQRAKGARSGLHDALLLRWVQLERERSPRGTWLLTLDTSLPGLPSPHQGARPRPLAITLDVLLQWIAAIAPADDGQAELAAVFSEAVKYRLLPQESFFELRDFLVFAEMELSCKELPAQDVEECIRYLKQVAPTLDPSLPADREKMAHEVSRFFADPGRKYKREVQRLEAQLEDLQAQRAREAARTSVRRRLACVLGVFVLVEAAAVWVAWRFAEGNNLLQKVVNFWDLVLAAVAVAGLLFHFLLGWGWVRKPSRAVRDASEPERAGRADAGEADPASGE